MMRAGFAGNLDATLFCLTNKFHRTRGGNVLAVDMPVHLLGNQNIARHDHVFANRRPPAQAERRAPMAFIHHAVGD